MTQRTLGDYIIKRQIGSGAYGTVYAAYKRDTGELVAIKSINHAKLVNKKLQENLDTEIQILQQTRHRNIVALYDVLKTENETHLVMEYCGGGELSTFMKKRKRLSESVARWFLQQIAAALEFMRVHNLIHRDLKPSNILLMKSDDDRAILKIADFGYARYIDPYGVAETSCGTPLYMAPEVFAAESYNAKVDLWSVGCILYEMVCGKVPFLEKTQVLLFKLINETKVISFPLDVHLSNDCQDLLRRLLRKNPLERISLESFFLHPFLEFSKYERENPYQQNTLSIEPMPSSHLGNSQETQGQLAIEEAMSTRLSLPVPVQEQSFPAKDPWSAESSPSNALLATTNQIKMFDALKTSMTDASEDFVMVDPKAVENHATVDVLLRATVIPGHVDQTTTAFVTFGNGSPSSNILTSPSTRNLPYSPSQGVDFNTPTLVAAAVYSQSPPTASALSRALASTAELFGGSSIDPGQQLARDIMIALKAQDNGNQITCPTDENTLMMEMELLARGALALLDYAVEMQQLQLPASDIYMIYVKTLVIFTSAFKKARSFWDIHGQRITSGMHEIIKTLNTKYQECLDNAELIQKQLQQQSDAPLTMSTSTLLRSSNKIYELLVGRAKKLAQDGFFDELKNDRATVRKYTQAVLLLEMVLVPDDQQPLTPQQHEYVQLLVKQTRDRLQKIQTQALVQL